MVKMDFLSKSDSNNMLYFKKEQMLLEDTIKNNEFRLRFLKHIKTKNAAKEREEVKVIISYNKKRLKEIKKKIEYWNPKYTRKDLGF